MTTTPTPLARLSRRFGRSESGAVAPILGVLALVVIGCMGIAIDMGRAAIVRARLLDSLDAAGLAVGARLSTSDYTVDARKFVDANFAAGFAGATVTGVTASANAAKNVISLSATATMPTSFMKLFGTPVVEVRATSEVTRAAAGLELVMVLDNTGSMETSSSMPTLRQSAKDLTNILFGDQTTADNLYVGLVPFSQAVNIGASRTAWMDPTSKKGTFPVGWKGCVEARAGDLDKKDDVPSLTANTNRFKYYYYPKRGDSYEKLLYNYRGGPNRGCPQEVTPMTNVKAKILAAADLMKGDGNTHINLGAVWGWRMLSPKWRGFWGGDMGSYALPLDYGTKRMSKAVVLMTDGENTMFDGTYTAYGDLSDRRIDNTTSESVAAKGLDNRLTSVCTSMKSAGILVYTVAFGINDKEVKAMIQGCATGAAYYFDAGDKAALTTAFKTIGDSLSNLRVSR